MLIEATDADGLNGLKGFLGEVLAGSFVADSAYSSSTMSKYYELLDDLDSSVKTAKFKYPKSYKKNWEYDLQRALAAGFGDKISDLNKQARGTEDENEKRALKYQIQELAKQALDFAEKVKSGEITDPVNYVKYDQYGATVRDTIIRMNAEEGDTDTLKDFSYLPSESIPDIEGHDTTDEEKARYKEIYQEHYTEFAVGTIETEKFKKATLEEQAAMLEGARELAGFYAKKEWATEFGLKSFNKFGRVTYDPKTASSTANIMFEGGIPADKVGSILRGISDIEPPEGSDSATTNQKYQYILDRKDLSAQEREIVLDAYIPSGSRAKYEGWTGTTKVDGKTIRSGISTEQYVRIQLAIGELKPTGGNKGVSEAQRLTAIANFHGLTDKQRYSLMVCAETSYEEGSDNTSGEAWRRRLYGAQEAGISAGAFMKVYTDTSSFDAKDENGETVNGLKKKRIAKYLRGTLLLTDYQKGYIWKMFYEKSTWDGWKYE